MITAPSHKTWSDRAQGARARGRGAESGEPGRAQVTQGLQVELKRVPKWPQVPLVYSFETSFSLLTMAHAFIHYILPDTI